MATEHEQMMLAEDPPSATGCHCLEFDSSWNEGRNRRSVYIRFNIAQRAFQVAIDEDNNLYHVPVVYGARTGDAVGVWDLHVGAEIDILGRVTTLHHCSQMTAQWNQYWRERLVPLQKRLLEELRKYDTRKLPPWLTREHRNPEVGGADLRLMMSQVSELKALLMPYRPRLAEKLGVPQEMYDIEENKLIK
eukprot:TRINITY_DN41415_c0_g1_i1.p1 TRINITY_DN41415_c0_g1~~TRINITY_DN41415_c0_g1_i1.p1  ORF type:complete len:191 (-),score=43.26 TRINITY_DN41415_c0_g1_i1:75-647(-)